MKKTLLFTLLLYCTFINAQISFEKGYFISNDGKKTDCYIRNLDWMSNPTNFKYKLQLNDSDVKTESIETAQEFSIDNECKYKRLKVNIDRANDDQKEATGKRNPEWKEETVFLKVLVEGEAILYSYREDSGDKFFYSTQTVPAEELVRVSYLKNGENGGYIMQLSNNVRSSNIADKDVKNLNYKKSDFIKYFTKYNNIQPATGENEATKASKKLLFVKVTPGLSFASVSAKNSANSSLNVDFDNKMVFKIGAEVEYVFPFNKNKWSLFANPMYQKYESEKNYIYYSTSAMENRETPYNAKIDYSSVQMPVGIRHYMFLNQNSKIFINALYSFEISGNSKISYTNMTPGSIAKGDFESHSDTNFAFGLGYNFKSKFSVEARFNTKKELMDYQTYSAKYNAVDFIVGYTIF
ncbi:outer membrane protein with beta-barrel domain [Flavobacterium cutihirudinis]|uniref:Outer membrane protein with beta-barrel domain n=1 Tax=Flavobacterium cutihirudinis TaxID=1265740 RepID=A0A3D9FY14_9FLAO|nr:outer membrane beta-barrel protein [Flavobacterium cutihirudinis]RED25037.1 outer membrane protein with beta-barrel domain [Flavobacterium cutihirudinis]